MGASKKAATPDRATGRPYVEADVIDLGAEPKEETPPTPCRLREHRDGSPGEIVWAHTPKQAYMINVSRVLVGWDEDNPDPAVINALDGIVRTLFPDDFALIEQRLNDPRDLLDYDDLMPALDLLVSRWSARPTGRPSGSPSRRRSAGKRSTARARSTGLRRSN